MELRPKGVMFGSELGGDRTETCDVCVVGSGPGGATVAEALVHAGRDVLLIEEGPVPLSGSAFSPEQAVPRYYRDMCLFATHGPSQVGVITGCAFGGTSVINSGTCLPTPDRAFDQWADEVGISFDRKRWEATQHEIWSELSVSDCPPELMSTSNRLFAEGLSRLGLSGGGPLPRCEIECEGSGRCCFVCPKDAKQAVHLNLLPSALAGGMRAVVETVASGIKMDGKRASHLFCRTRAGGKLTVRADTFVLAMGSLVTPRFLMRSKMGKRYPALGHHLSIHPASKVSAQMPEPVRSWEGVPQSYRYEHPGYPDLHFEGIFMPPHVGAMSLPLLGPDLRDWMQGYDRVVSFGFFVSDTSLGRLYHVPGVGPVIRYGLTEQDMDNFYFGMKLVAQAYFATGAERVLMPLLRPDVIYESAEALERRFLRDELKSEQVYAMAFHPLGTCRFASSTQTGVIDEAGRCREHENVYVADGSAIPGPAHANPMITIMTFARLVARGMI